MGIRSAKQCTMNRWGKAKVIMIIITGYKYYLTRCFHFCQHIIENHFQLKKKSVSGKPGRILVNELQQLVSYFSQRLSVQGTQ